MGGNVGGGGAGGDHAYHLGERGGDRQGPGGAGADVQAFFFLSSPCPHPDKAGEAERERGQGALSPGLTCLGADLLSPMRTSSFSLPVPLQAPGGEPGLVHQHVPSQAQGDLSQGPQPALTLWGECPSPLPHPQNESRGPYGTGPPEQGAGPMRAPLPLLQGRSGALSWEVAFPSVSRLAVCGQADGCTHAPSPAGFWRGRAIHCSSLAPAPCTGQPQRLGEEPMSSLCLFLGKHPLSFS